MMALARSLDARAWRLLFGAGLLIVLVAAVAFVLRPQYDAFVDSKQNLNMLSNALSSGATLPGEIANLSVQVDRLDRELHGTTSDLPRNQLEGRVVGRMQSLCWRHGLQLRSIRPGAGEQISVFEEVLFDVEIAGPYFDIYAWLNDLEAEIGFVVVRQFRLAPDAINAPGLVASFTMVAYREVSDAARG